MYLSSELCICTCQLLEMTEAKLSLEQGAIALSSAQVCALRLCTRISHRRCNLLGTDVSS